MWVNGKHEPTPMKTCWGCKRRTAVGNKCCSAELVWDSSRGTRRSGVVSQLGGLPLGSVAAPKKLKCRSVGRQRHTRHLWNWKTLNCMRCGAEGNQKNKEIKRGNEK